MSGSDTHAPGIRAFSPFGQTGMERNRSQEAAGGQLVRQHLGASVSPDTVSLGPELVTSDSENPLSVLVWHTQLPTRALGNNGYVSVRELECMVRDFSSELSLVILGYQRAEAQPDGQGVLHWSQTAWGQPCPLGKDLGHSDSSFFISEMGNSIVSGCKTVTKIK